MAKKFEEQMSAERKYYLGYTDTIPGSGTKIADAKKEYRKQVDAENKRMEERRQAVLAKVEPETFVSTVGNGELVEVQRRPLAESGSPIYAPEPEPATAASTPEELAKLSKKELTDKALEEHSHVIPDGMKKDEIIDVITGDQKPT